MRSAEEARRQAGLHGAGISAAEKYDDKDDDWRASSVRDHCATEASVILLGFQLTNVACTPLLAAQVLQHALSRHAPLLARAARRQGDDA